MVSTIENKRQERWKTAWSQLGVTPNPALGKAYQALCRRYAEPQRHYHTMAHIDACFTHLERHLPQAQQPGALAIALWYHDAIYDVHAANNELQSAQLAQEVCRNLAVDEPTQQQIYNLIMATAHQQDNNPQAIPDAPLLVDIDLGILGSPEAVFWSFEQAIRQEYHWVTATEYRQQRGAVLQHFLAMPNIYQTAYFREHYEQQARQNCQQAFERLTALPGN